MRLKKSWKKVLYEVQGYQDNYTDKKLFLGELRKNIDFKEITYWQALSAANLLIQELCSVVSFVLVYFYLVNEWVHPTIVMYWTSGLTTLGFFTYLALFGNGIKQKLGHYIRIVLTFVVFGQLFSPVLYTLTDTISTDTIYTMVFFSMLVHLIFFDYSVSSAVMSNSLSLSAAVFASICLASRLPSANHAFIFMTVATESFVLFPILRHEFMNSLVFSVCLLVGDTVCLWKISKLLTILFLCTITFIYHTCPALFVRYQSYKENIYGPWDEAVVDDADNIVFS